MQNYQNLINEIAKVSSFKFLAMDQDGSWFVHKEKPLKFGNGWVSGLFHNLGFIPEDTTINWQEAFFEAKTQNVLTGTKAEKYVM